MEKRTIAQQKKQNRARTKEDIICKIREIKSKGEDIILVESNKRKINLTINEFVLRQIEAMYESKSKVVEDILIELVEKELHKKIEIVKHKGNYKK